MTTEVPLHRAFLEDGVRRISFFDGRVLTADDMNDLQVATERRDRHLGEALGEGVAYGLSVTGVPGGTTLEVTPGRAVNRAGEVLPLDRPVRIPLLPPAQAPATGHAAFVACADAPPSVTPTGTGIYVLAMGSAAGDRGSAPAVHPGGRSASDCGPRYEVAGVQFRLVEVPDLEGLARHAGHDEHDISVLSAAPGTAGRLLLRNVLGHLFLGTVAFRRHVTDPLRLETDPPSRPGYGVIDRLHDGVRLTDCDVPLAVLSWSQGTVEFVDVHAVRRRPTSVRGPGSVWAELTAARRRAEAEATVLHFQDHIRSLVRVGGLAQTVLSDLVAADRFRYLPAVGFLPVLSPGAGGSRGLVIPSFLPGATDPLEISAADAERVVRGAFDGPAIDLRTTDPTLYRIAAPPGASEPRPFVLFSRHRLDLVDPHARHVGYEPDPACATLAGATTVQQALDRLCRPPVPEVTSLTPGTVRQGSVTTVLVGGTHLAGVEHVDFARLGVTAQLLPTAVWRVPLPLHTVSSPKAVAVSPDGRLLAVCDSSDVIRVRRSDTGAAVAECRALGAITSVDFGPQGRLLAGGDAQGRTYLWDATSQHATWPLVTRWDAHLHGPTLIRFSPQGRYLATAAGNLVRVWAAAGRPPPWPSVTGWNVVGGIHGLAWAPGDVYLAAAGQQGAQIRQQTEGTWPVVTQLAADVRAIAFSPDGSAVGATGSHSFTRLWRVSPTGTWHETHRWHVPGRALAFSPDSRRIAVSSADRVRVWAVGRGVEVAQAVDQDPVWDVAFTPDGGGLVTAARDLLLSEASGGTGTRLPVRVVVAPGTPPGRYHFEVTGPTGTGRSVEAALALTVEPASSAPGGYYHLYPQPYQHRLYAYGGWQGIGANLL
jgi:hypothetical protein